jgi:hypothetical protein
MNPNRTLGLILLVVGLTLLYFGLRATDSLSESITEGLSVSYTDKTLWLIVGGAVATIAGGTLAFFGARHKLA